MRGSFLLLVLGACTNGMYDPSTVEQQNGACVALEGRTFTSVDELECGRTPDGAAKCHWGLVFAIRDLRTSDFAWSYSDVTETGKVECRGSAITATAGGRTIIGSFDSRTQMLAWGDQTYVANP